MWRAGTSVAGDGGARHSRGGDRHHPTDIFEFGRACCVSECQVRRVRAQGNALLVFLLKRCLRWPPHDPRRETQAHRLLEAETKGNSTSTADRRDDDKQQFSCSCGRFSRQSVSELLRMMTGDCSDTVRPKISPREDLWRIQESLA